MFYQVIKKRYIANKRITKNEIISVKGKALEVSVISGNNACSKYAFNLSLMTINHDGRPLVLYEQVYFY